jgi:hypothetical protein
MLEKWFEQGKENCGKQGRKLLKRAGCFPAGAWIAALVLLLVAMRFCWASVQRPAHLAETAAECGSFGALYGQPMPDRTGSRLAYAQSSERGVGIFLYDSTTRKSQLVHEYNGPTRIHSLLPWWRFLMPWSPDDASFAYTGDLATTTAVYYAQSGNVEEVSCSNSAAFSGNGLSTTWLTKDSYVYLSDPLEFHLMQKQENGRWEDTTRPVSPELMDTKTTIIATSSNTVVWLHGNSLWTMDVSASNTPVLLFEPAKANNPLLSEIRRISYSAETGQFLLTGNGSQGTGLWRLIALHPDMGGGQWINGGKGYSYGVQYGRHRSLVVQAEPSAEPVSLFSLGMEDDSDYTTSGDGKRLFIEGVVRNEFKPSIWQYDLDSATLQCVVPAMDWHFARKVIQRTEYLDLPSGRKSFTLFVPPDFDRHQHKCYPLVIASPYFADHCENFANCGIICALVDRSLTDDPSVWENDVLAVSKHLAGNAYVDSKRVYLTAACAEVSLLSHFQSLGSGRWDGLLLLGTYQSLDTQALVSKGTAPRIYINTGLFDGDPESINRNFKEYQLKADRAGVMVDSFVTADAAHIFISNHARLERIKTETDFIFNE